MDLPVLMVLAVTCVAIGFVLDNLLHSMRGGNADSAAPDKEKVSVDQGVPAPEEALGADSSLPPQASEGQEWEEVVRIWRKLPEQDLTVEVSGKAAHAPSDLDRDQLDLIGSVLQQLSAWLGQGVPPAAPGLDSRREGLVTLPAGQTAVPLEALLGVELPGESTLEEARREAQARRPSLNPIQVVANALRADLRRSPASMEMKSLAVQVDEVLQEKLKGTPLEKRGIQLMEGPDQGLIVRVGLEKYAGVDEVPDAEIREMIHQAVAEWGKKTNLMK